MVEHKKVFAFIQTDFGPNGLVGTALCECGMAVCSHFSSNKEWAKHDIMKMHRPDIVAHTGSEDIEIIWLDDPMKDTDFIDALSRNKGMD